MIAGALSACATTNTPDPWAGLEVSEERAARPLECGPFPLPLQATENGFIYDPAGVRALDAYKACAETNQAVADAHAAQIDANRAGQAALIEAGQAQHRVVALQREIIEEERRARFWERLQYWFLIAVFGAAAL